ncbi:nitroreductase family protein [Elusimicrobiota bacterium]
MDTLEAIKKRTSVRMYTNKPIDKKILDQIVEAGNLAPTAYGDQPWEFVVVINKKILANLGDIANSGKFIKDSAATIIVFCKNSKYFLEDGCAATQNMIIAATALGIGTCWVAGDKKPYMDTVRELLGVPADYKLVSLIPMGHPQKQTTTSKKRKASDVVHWEKFNGR